MTKQDFIRYLSHPEELDSKSMLELEKVVRQYPYFQTARLLYLKNLHNEHSIEYEKNLNITSAYAPAGKVLYNLIKVKPGAGRKIQVEENVQAEIRPAIKTASSQETILKEEAIVVLQEISMTEVQEAEKDAYDELQLLEKEILKEAFKTSLTVDLLKEPHKSQDRIQKLETVNEIQKAHSFTGWLKVVSGKNPASPVQEKGDQKKQQSSLIDNFILEERSRAVTKPKVEFYSADAMAKKSITDDETFVTETLASIYLKQGNLPKALRAYEILMVKYPEKIHIFAPLLEKIKNLLKEQKHK